MIAGLAHRAQQGVLGGEGHWQTRARGVRAESGEAVLERGPRRVGAALYS